MTTYNANIPASGDNMSISQGEILGNFDQLNTQFAIDHTAFNTGSGNGDGFHKKITLANVSAPSAPTAPVSYIYSKTVGGTQQLYFRNDTAETQVTGATVASSSGSTLLPGGIIMKWGTWTLANGVASTPVTFAGAFPNNVFSLAFGTNTSGSPNNCPIWQDGTLTTSGFTGARVTGSSGGTYTYKYIAIGN